GLHFQIYTYTPSAKPEPSVGTLIKAHRGSEVRLLLSSSATSAGEDLYSIPQQARGCRRIRKLVGRTSYSPAMCILNKIRSEMKRLCKCVPITVKTAMTHVTDRVCKFSELHCVSNFTQSAEGSRFRNALHQMCLPGCAEVTYNHLVKVYPSESDNTPCSNCIFLDVYFEEYARGVVYERRRTVSETSIFLRTSGLLGLLLGCSCLVFTEIIYFSAQVAKVLILGE
ncbi:Acid-sensing ion channel 4-B, partial [Frankliniella fusca]